MRGGTEGRNEDTRMENGREEAMGGVYERESGGSEDVRKGKRKGEV